MAPSLRGVQTWLSDRCSSPATGPQASHGSASHPAKWIFCSEYQRSNYARLEKIISVYAWWRKVLEGWVAAPRFPIGCQTEARCCRPYMFFSSMRRRRRTSSAWPIAGRDTEYISQCEPDWYNRKYYGMACGDLLPFFLGVIFLIDPSPVILDRGDGFI
jgi:hypothetical protein